MYPRFFGKRISLFTLTSVVLLFIPESCVNDVFK